MPGHRLSAGVFRPDVCRRPALWGLGSRAPPTSASDGRPV